MSFSVHRNSLWAVAEVYATLDDARAGVEAIMCPVAEEDIGREQQADDEQPLDKVMDDTARGEVRVSAPAGHYLPAVITWGPAPASAR